MAARVDRIRWSPKVGRPHIRRLYENDARGLVDERLIDEVGLTLLLRCRDILLVTRGEAHCPACGTVVRFRGGHRQPDVPVPCPTCAWQATYRAFHLSWRHHDLYGGNAVPAFETYVRGYPLARTARERLLVIDALIHSFHKSLKQAVTPHTRTAGENLIEGSKRQVVELLDTLAYGDAGAPETRAAKEQWRRERGGSGAGAMLGDGHDAPSETAPSASLGRSDALGPEQAR